MYLKLTAAVGVACIGYFISVVFRHATDSSEDKHTFMATSNDVRQSLNLNRLSSSVWCIYDKTFNKMCTFKNICYVPDLESFVFLLGNESIITGLNSRDDFKTISLASVENHNNMFMKIQILVEYHEYFSDKEKDNIVFIKEPILLISRFKSDNIMHVIHDDLLPIYVTYDSLCSGDIFKCVKSNRLMFADKDHYSSHVEWYKIFSNKKPYSLSDLRMLTCFDKIFVGVSRETLWFQYGFGKPQGPLISSGINSLTINKFKNFVLNQFKIDKPDSRELDIVFLNRKLNRKILNENFVVSKIREVSRSIYPEFYNRIKVHIVDPSQNKSTDILSVVIRSQIFVGMHGSAMIYTLFLQNNAAIVELFPFSIQAQHVSSTRALSQLPGTFYNYLSWRNFKESNSVGHPERPPLLGGIQHLPNEEQDRIIRLKEVPAVQCCHDPAYLYRMFQDTIIDDSFPVILKQALLNQKETISTSRETLVNNYLKSTWLFPGSVSNVSCSIDKSKGVLFIKWHKPYNIQIMNFETSVFYYVTIKIFSRVVTLETYIHSVSVKLSNNENVGNALAGIQVWLRAINDDIEGPEAHLHC